jgi:hypothetical protein
MSNHAPKTLTGPELITRDATLLSILRYANIQNENGDKIEDFTNQDRDCLDFTSISRSRLRSLLNAAYEAGLRSAVR